MITRWSVVAGAERARVAVFAAVVGVARDGAHNRVGGVVVERRNSRVRVGCDVGGGLAVARTAPIPSSVRCSPATRPKS